MADLDFLHPLPQLQDTAAKCARLLLSPEKEGRINGLPVKKSEIDGSITVIVPLEMKVLPAQANQDGLFKNKIQIRQQFNGDKSVYNLGTVYGSYGPGKNTGQDMLSLWVRVEPEEEGAYEQEYY